MPASVAKHVFIIITSVSLSNCSSLQHQPDIRNRAAGQSGAYGANTGRAGTAGTPDLHPGPAGRPVRARLQQGQGGTRQVKVGKLKSYLTLEEDQDIQTNPFTARKENDLVMRAIDANERNLQMLESSRSNRLRRFGEHVPALLSAIEEAHRKGQFKRKPRGPLGKKPPGSTNATNI